MNQLKKQFNSKKTILAIESSCDETAVALLEATQEEFFIRKSFIASQQKIHARYGGIVPEVAARSHITALMPLIKKTIGRKIPDAIAVTAGPGLITSLFVGVHTARALSYIYRKPLIRVNHIEGHIYANWLSNSGSRVKGQKGYRVEGRVKFPALALIVSGGHTELIFMKDHGVYKIIGKTLDDAAGEAFDKAAKILDLPYPGGPAVSVRARYGDARRSPLPIPMIDSKNHSFSFSGLKTALLYRVRNLKESGQYSEQMRDHLCAAFQHSVVTALIAKTVAAAQEYEPRSILLGGGVAANESLRAALASAVAPLRQRTELVISPLNYCTDNAAMIAVAAFFQMRKKRFVSPFACAVDPVWGITNE